jgi:aspartate aminotransferase-like enzyme
VVHYDTFAAKHQTPSTPATSLLYALEAQMGDIGREGIERRWERHEAMRETVVNWVNGVSERRNIDIRILAPNGARSPTVSVIVVPEKVRGPDLVEGVKVRGYTIGGGYGQLKERTVRIGHMGDHNVDGLKRCLHACETALAELTEGRRLVRA